MSEVERRVALVTGASRGIGAAVAERLASQGMDVALNHSSESGAAAAQELARRLSESYGVEAVACQADVSSFDQVKDMVKGLKQRFGRIDVLVNNAGITRDGLVLRMSEESFDRVLDVNLKGAFNCMRHVAPLMVKQRYGRIVSLSSVVGVAGNAGQANYSASKAGIIGLTKSVAKELAPRGITANAVAPGFIVSDMTDAMPEQAREAVLERIAQKAFGNPEDVAHVVAFLADPESGYVTGQVICVDGGMSL